MSDKELLRFPIFKGVFNAALYRYATTKNVPPGFDPDASQQAWQPRQ
jgi:hypothetical protein